MEHRMTREEIPDAVDQLHAQVRDTYGEDSDLYRAMCPLYALAARELMEFEEHERLQSDTDDALAVHAAVLRAEAAAIRRGAW